MKNDKFQLYTVDIEKQEEILDTRVGKSFLEFY